MNDNSKKYKVVVSETLSDRALEWLAERAEVVRTNPDRVVDVIGDADALIVRTYTEVNGDLLDKAPQLKAVGRAGVALENVDVPECRSRGVEVVHTPAANTNAVVDYTIRMIIELNRKFWPITGYLEPEEFHSIRKDKFGYFLADLTLGIIGCGRIGSRVGKAAAGLGMRVLYNDIKDIEVDYPAEAVDKQTIYEESDVITVHTPLTDLTRGLIDAKTIAEFKDGAKFINAARGPIVNYKDLANAIRTGKVSGAAIDCHDPEPFGRDYPMLQVLDRNVILTPHIAARVPQAMENMCDVVHDIIAVLEGRQPDWPAQPEAYGG
ncbi:MAG: NAD(P)-dependent oxidoreductase [Phycisphaerae bacterium]